MPFNPEKLAKLLASNKSTQTGGKGSVRRKNVAEHKSGVVDDKKLKATFNKLGVREIPAIEEVNLFKDDGNVIHFQNPKVQASIAANTYVVSGNNETKKLSELLPGIITQLGPDSLSELRKIYQAFASEKAGGAGAATAAAGKKDDDDDVPDLVENFEEVAKSKADAPAAAAATTTTTSK